MIRSSSSSPVMRISEQTGERGGEYFSECFFFRDVITNDRGTLSVFALLAVVLPLTRLKLGEGGEKTVQNTAFPRSRFWQFFFELKLVYERNYKRHSPPAAVPFVSRADTHFTLLKLTVSFLNVYLGLRGSV